jgi:hypothetical protein
MFNNLKVIENEFRKVSNNKDALTCIIPAFFKKITSVRGT